MDWLAVCLMLPIILIGIAKAFERLGEYIDSYPRRQELKRAAEAALRAEKNCRIWPLPEATQTSETEQERIERARAQEIEFQHNWEAAWRYMEQKTESDDPPK